MRWKIPFVKFGIAVNCNKRETFHINQANPEFAGVSVEYDDVKSMVTVLDDSPGPLLIPVQGNVIYMRQGECIPALPIEPDDGMVEPKRRGMPKGGWPVKVHSEV